MNYKLVYSKISPLGPTKMCTVVLQGPSSSNMLNSADLSLITRLAQAKKILELKTANCTLFHFSGLQQAQSIQATHLRHQKSTVNFRKQL